jgi:protein-tyrosine phosphatase
MIDLHSHVLPGLDDGAADMEESLRLAGAASAAGTTTLVATPHVREDFPYPRTLIGERSEELRSELTRAGIDLRIVEGAEVAIPEIDITDDETMAGLCLGDGRNVLVESPYTQATGGLEYALFELQLRGFGVVLAHPERSPTFIADVDRLASLVERGVVCSITAGSMRGDYGRTVRRAAAEMLERGLVHDVASDAHDVTRRPPVLGNAFTALDAALPGLAQLASWFVEEAPAAILRGEHPGPPPPLRAATRRRRAPWRRTAKAFADL